MEHDRHNFFSSWTIFCLFTSPPPTAQKIKILKKWKKCLEILSLYTSASKIMTICYTVPEIWHVMNVLAIFHFGPFFALFPSNSPKNQNFKKKWKKYLEISSFYTGVPKIMIICYTVTEIWCVTDVIVIFHFGLFFALLSPPPPNSPKMKKPPGDIIILHMCTRNYD